MHRHAVIAAALIALASLPACTSAPKPAPPNKLQEAERRFWGKPESKPPRNPDQPPATAPDAHDSSSSINFEDSPLPAEIADKITAAMEANCPGDHPSPAEIARVEPAQLTPDGGQGLLVTVRPSCLCSPTGNCPRQIWTKDQNGRFVQSLAEDAYDLLFANTVHNGYYDVVTEAYLSARESTILRYEWDGKEYHPVEQSCRVGDGDISARKVVSGRCR